MQGRSNYALAHLVAGSRLGLIALTKRKGDIYGRVHVFPHTLRSIFGRAANPEFLPRFSCVARAVCQPPQVAPSNKWSLGTCR